mmetsp:Transcript_39489/g.129167  ORF Transcript_39489/g.129167 Transcript_39489/m.129167 type:complete len:260 (+) Transcript_39489:295-1074(+)
MLLKMERDGLPPTASLTSKGSPPPPIPPASRARYLFVTLRAASSPARKAAAPRVFATRISPQTRQSSRWTADGAGRASMVERHGGPSSAGSAASRCLAPRYGFECTPAGLCTTASSSSSNQMRKPSCSSAAARAATCFGSCSAEGSARPPERVTSSPATSRRAGSASCPLTASRPVLAAAFACDVEPSAAKALPAKRASRRPDSLPAVAGTVACSAGRVVVLAVAQSRALESSSGRISFVVGGVVAVLGQRGGRLAVAR